VSRKHRHRVRSANRPNKAHEKRRHPLRGLRGITVTPEIVEQEESRAVVELYQQGVHHLARADYETALAKFHEALKDADKRTRAALFNYIGLCKYGTGDLDGAGTAFLQSMNLADDVEDDRGSAAAICNLGLMSALVGQFTMARRMLKESMHLARRTDFPLCQANCYANFGVVFLIQGRLGAARRCASRAVEVLNTVEHAKDMARFSAGPQYTEADLLDHEIDRAVTRFRSKGEPGRSEIVELIGKAHRLEEQERLEEAEPVLLRAATMARELGLGDFEIAALAPLALVQWQNGKQDSAQASLKRLDELLPEYPQLKRDARVEELRGHFCFKQGKYQEALPDLVQAFRLNLESDDGLGLARVGPDLKEVYILLGPDAIRDACAERGIAAEATDRILRLLALSTESKDED
jgi:tetratricopeptide (TPR) repeat protein